MIALVEMICGVCASEARIEVKAEPCEDHPNHVHIRMEEVQSWRASHHQPGFRILMITRRSSEATQADR